MRRNQPYRSIPGILLLLTLAFAGKGNLCAQQENITLHADSLSVTDFISWVEHQYHLEFYYDDSWLPDTAWAPVDFEQAALGKALANFFRLFDLGVYRRGQNIYLTRNLTINPAFARDFSRKVEENSSEPTYFINNIIAIKQEEKETLFPELDIIQFGIPTQETEGKRYRIYGTVTEMNTGQPVIGATLQVAGTSIGTATNEDGSYVLNIPSGKHEIIIRAIGKQTTHRQLSVYGNGKLDVDLSEDITEIEEVVVVGKTDDKVNTLTGSEKLDLGMIRKTVMVMGETDILKGILAMPGVQSITEVSNGFNVRGGSTDQNLVRIDDIPVMNSSHFFGFFSSFNSDLVSDATLYKSGIPADMGGRISSILDISSRKGSKEHFAGTGGISPVTARLAVEGPLLKNRVSFIAGGRSTYSDWLMKRIQDTRINNSSAYFYDGFANLDLDLTESTSLSASLYHSNDYFKFDEFLTHRYANLGGAIHFNTRISDRTRYDASFTYSEFDFSITDEYNPATASQSAYNITQYGLNNHFRWSYDRWFDLTFGLDAILYRSEPGTISPAGDESIVLPVSLENEHAVESALFVQNEQHITSWLSLSYGLRYSGYANLGEGTVYRYDPLYSKSVATMTDTVTYLPGEVQKFYQGPEFRFLAKIMTGRNSSVKISYNRMRQYINLISNTITPAPTDIWKLCDFYFQPQLGDQYSIGYFRDLIRKTNNILSLSLEAYYKTTDHILDFKTGADLFANEHFETEVMEGENHSYGLELQLTKERGSFYGWANYTYARSLNHFASRFPEETINYGNWYPSNHDKPHQFKAVLNYDFYKRLSLSANLNYSTGRPVTLPVTSFLFGGTKRIQFAERNQHRMPDYFRVDISATLDGRYNLDKLAHGSFTLSIVNVTGRKNPYSVFFQYDERGRLKAYYLSIFGVPIVTLTYNIKF